MLGRPSPSDLEEEEEKSKKADQRRWRANGTRMESLPVNRSSQ